MSNAKVVRGQLRQIAKELLPEVINQEQYEVLKKHIDSRINEIEAFVKKTLTEMNENHKNTMGYLVRQATLPAKKD